MRKQFEAFIIANQLFTKEDKILLAISGGIDSMTLLHLMSKFTSNIAIAHCNFKLRGVDADMDQQFVEEKAKHYGIKLHAKKFKTKEYAQEKGISIQMAARELRYNWFNDLCRQEGYKYVVTAHHKDDIAETILLNLSRGSGIRGLHGIKPKNNRIVRPLLFATKDELERYAAKKKLAYKTDESNFSTKYARNRIRMNVIPQLQKINPSAVNNIYHTSQLISEAEDLLNEHIQEQLSNICIKTDSLLKISIEALSRLKHKAYYLYELLAPFGFNESVVYDVLENLHSESGKYYFSETHRLLRDRAYLLLEERAEQNNDVYTFNKNETFIAEPIELHLDVQEKDDTFELMKEQGIACLDFDKLSSQLSIRKWQTGDSFKPLGMKGKKKLSDFFIDGKLSLSEKENTWILTSNEEIVWVIGQRIDDRFKVNDKTKKVLLVSLS